MAIQAEAWQLMQLANQTRATAGLGPLLWDPALATAARQHCQRMATEGQISHRYGGEPDLTARAGQAGAHFSLVEENIAVGAHPATIHQAWMNSPGHRANLLNPEINRVGIAVVADGEFLFAVADYARDVPVLSQIQVEATVGQQIRAHKIDLLSDPTGARRACDLNRGLPQSLAGPQPLFVMRWQDADISKLPEALLDRLSSGDYHRASVGSCPAKDLEGSFTLYRMAVLLY